MKKDENLIKNMLSDTILALCRNTLPYEGEVCVEGLLGITLDNKEIFLVNINETIHRDGARKSPSKRKGRVEKEEGVSSDEDDSSSHESESGSNASLNIKRRRKRRKKSKEKDKVDDNVESKIVEDNLDSRLSIFKQEGSDDNNDAKHIDNNDNDDDDLVFVKEEPNDYSPTTSQSCSFGAGTMSMSSQADPHLQELAVQLAGNDVMSSQFGSAGFGVRFFFFFPLTLATLWL